MTNLSWDIGTAYDFFVSLHVLYHPEDYGLRRAWAAGVRSRLPTAEREALGEILEIMFPPVSWIYELPAPKDSATLLTHLARLPAAERLPSLVLGEHVPAAITERLQDIASRGSWNDDDQQYLQEFLKQYEERAPKRKTVHRALELWSQCERVGEQLLDGLKMFHAVFFAEEETRIQPVLRDAVVRSQKMASRLPLSELLDELDELTAAAKDDSILDVAPLRDNNAHDWLSEARAAFAEKRYADSRRAIKEGLALSPEDPELLQLRAELDLLAGEWKTASLGAYRAWQHSAKVGPLCRRQWATIALARRERGSIEASQRALDQMARCRVEPLPRF